MYIKAKKSFLYIYILRKHLYLRIPFTKQQKSRLYYAQKRKGCGKKKFRIIFPQIIVRRRRKMKQHSWNGYTKTRFSRRSPHIPLSHVELARENGKKKFQIVDNLYFVKVISAVRRGVRTLRGKMRNRTAVEIGCRKRKLYPAGWNTSEINLDVYNLKRNS